MSEKMSVWQRLHKFSSVFLICGGNVQMSVSFPPLTALAWHTFGCVACRDMRVRWTVCDALGLFQFRGCWSAVSLLFSLFFCLVFVKMAVLERGCVSKHVTSNSHFAWSLSQWPSCSMIIQWYIFICFAMINCLRAFPTPHPLWSFL